MSLSLLLSLSLSLSLLLSLSLGLYRYCYRYRCFYRYRYRYRYVFIVVFVSYKQTDLPPVVRYFLVFHFFGFVPNPKMRRVRRHIHLYSLSDAYLKKIFYFLNYQVVLN
jgi:hypothetical protein